MLYEIIKKIIILYVIFNLCSNLIIKKLNNINKSASSEIKIHTYEDLILCVMIKAFHIKKKECITFECNDLIFKIKATIYYIFQKYGHYKITTI